MFWTEDGRGKKEKRKEKSVGTWVEEKKRGKKKKEKKGREPTCVERKKERKKRNYITIFSQYFHNKS